MRTVLLQRPDREHEHWGRATEGLRADVRPGGVSESHRCSPPAFLGFPGFPGLARCSWFSCGPAPRDSNRVDSCAATPCSSRSRSTIAAKAVSMKVERSVSGEGIHCR
ncbi:hypothetical protein ACFFX0_02730 [Citricoccus parietis]|uniref:Uncharacterized protein n=1 Tax=Citricoccus parietis TaxID=592307 RepID=A0ABV5FU26_9MICC